MKKIFILLISLLFAVPAYANTIYKWVDKEGVVNYTDDINNVPKSYRDRVKREEFLQEKESPAQAMNAKTNEAIKTDIYGRDETWWREKVHPWKEQLKEATKNHEKAQEEYMEQAQGLSPYNFGKMSLTQYQMLSSRLEILHKKMEMYQDQITEAKEMLSKLSNEAKETRADPSWLE